MIYNFEIISNIVTGSPLLFVVLRKVYKQITSSSTLNFIRCHGLNFRVFLTNVHTQLLCDTFIFYYLNVFNLDIIQKNWLKNIRF